MTNQILSRSLHQADDECMQYTTMLVDKLESMKTQYASDDTITDDVAGQAYVEQFGLETFQRADNAVRANSVTKQTADTFLAAATFLDLVQIWGAPSQEIVAKIKYAKYHAVRIAKAIKAGEDPNDSNPEPAPVPTEDAVVQLDPEDPEVKDIENPAGSYQPPSIVDEQAHVDQQLLTERAAQWNAASLPRPNGEVPPTPEASAAAPVDSRTTQDINHRQDSIGGGYFPEVQSPPTDAQQPANTADLFDIPCAASHDPNAPIIVQPPAIPPAPAFDPYDFYNDKMDIDPATAGDPPDEAPLIAPKPVHPSTHLPPQPPAASKPLWSRSAASTPKPPAVPSAPTAPTATTRTGPSAITAGFARDVTDVDDAAMAEAQKHAKWAISALNFEDVATAVKELRIALGALGQT